MLVCPFAGSRLAAAYHACLPVSAHNPNIGRQAHGRTWPKGVGRPVSPPHTASRNAQASYRNALRKNEKRADHSALFTNFCSLSDGPTSLLAGRYSLHLHPSTGKKTHLKELIVRGSYKKKSRANAARPV
jgi:hypothetical protein